MRFLHDALVFIPKIGWSAAFDSADVRRRSEGRRPTMHAHVTRHTARAPPRMQAPHSRAATSRPAQERDEALAAFWVKIHRRNWMTEEMARAYRRRSLLQDNPASG